MQTQNYWKQFENTGKIEDYLSYKGADRNGEGPTAGNGFDAGIVPAAGNGTAAGNETTENTDGTVRDAGIYTGDRNGFETGAHWGIRPEGHDTYP